MIDAALFRHGLERYLDGRDLLKRCEVEHGPLWDAATSEMESGMEYMIDALSPSESA